MKLHITLSDIINNKLCNTCGGCYGICPTQAIRFEETIGGYYLPVIDENLCTFCGLCVEICPGIGLSNFLLENLPDDPFAGKFLGAYVGRATNKRFFDNSQSGGIVSALLAHALRTGVINGAVTVYQKSGSPSRPMVQIAKNNQEIFQSQKSKYYPVPLLCFLRDLKQTDCPLAVVGTSCQIHGLRNILEKIPTLKTKIAFTIGLVCDRVLTYAALDFLLEKSGLDRNNIERVHFRDKSVSGYPGDVHFLSNCGKSVVLPSSHRMRIKDFFTPARCRICFDKMNIYSDITVGDPHGLDGINRKLGESMFVVRTEVGRDVVQAAKDDAAIDIHPTQYDKVLKGQGMNQKRNQWRGYIDGWKISELEVPNFYNLVKQKTIAPENIKNFLRDLQYSFSLDESSSRESLIRQVNKILKRKQIVDTLLFPAQLIKRYGRKFFFIFQ